ncbi:Alpha/beta hydrolase fold-1 [Ephemerocybe angulata]|uniref:Alpha/beta hydrolase fold-1 n=1 Tax=Ephemerocybe angulata TaxID=980116 RepID=A0A8H6M019_9AGAR|nr:Alpha/beta hydrolase fold-1 [Tulosesus angulatus]
MANSSEDLRVELHTFQTPDPKYTQPGAGLWVCAKRYTTPSSIRDTEGLTLLFTHCNGSHKEEWDLVISRLFALQKHKPESVRIREAWSFDRQNHGDAAVLNAHALVKRGDTVSLYEWAHALRSFVDSPLLRGHHLVALGHSAGATAWMLTTFSPPPIPYTALFLIEPTITPQHIFERELAERQSYMDLVVQLTLNRKSEWKTKDAAYAYFKKRIPWSMWDDRAVRMFVEHGLHDAPDVRRGLTLKWTKEQEAASYPDTKPHHESAVQLAKISKAVPVHLIWGERVEFMPEYLRDALSDQNEGMDVASVSYVEDAGHMVRGVFQS